MKTPLFPLAAVLLAIIALSGCGKPTAATSTENENSATNYPLPDPPVVVNCTPGIRGGKFVICEIREPKTFNFLISDELSSRYIGRLMFWSLLNFDVPTQTVKPGL